MLKPAKEYYKELPKKRVSAGILLFNEKGELLIVKTNYKEHWSLPGGVADADESPRDACLREVEEEVGLTLKEIEFVCVDYCSQSGDRSEALHFLYTGRELAEDEIAGIHLGASEIEQCRFVGPAVAIKLLSNNFNERLPKCLLAIENRTPIYLENGN